MGKDFAQDISAGFRRQRRTTDPPGIGAFSRGHYSTRVAILMANGKLVLLIDVDEDISHWDAASPYWHHQGLEMMPCEARCIQERMVTRAAFLLVPGSPNSAAITSSIRSLIYRGGA